MKRASLGLALAALVVAPSARATGFTDIGDDIRAHTETGVTLNGALRARGELFYNLDLDRGPTPSGQLFFPVPLGDPKAQTLTSADLRLRTDLAFYAPFASAAVKVRVDAPDDLAMGSAPEGNRVDTATQQPISAIRIKRAYGEALTPFGLLAIGRQGATWGLGMLTNGGDCADCDSGDAADRIAFVTPVLGHIFAAAFDFSAVGPLVKRQDGARSVDIDPSAGVRTLTFAVLRWRNDLARARRQAADKATMEYGAFVSHRWQDQDVPADYLPFGRKVALNDAQVMSRGYTATAIDGWARFTAKRVRIELEAALLLARIEQPSLEPGVLIRTPITSRQIGAALESEFGAESDTFAGGLDAGYASGDPAPGFGANVGLTQAAPKPGDLDGPQASPPNDTTVDNFRFHPDYRIDRILFREIIGTVTDAIYFRPHARATLARIGPARLDAELFGVVSMATYASSTPGNSQPLGVEVDPTLAYKNRDGFSVALEHGALFPLSGLDNVQKKLSAKPAQIARVRVTYAF